MNPYFGEPWNSFFCEESEGARQVETPVGVPCIYCQVPVEKGDQGIIMPAILEGGVATQLPEHRECFWYAVWPGRGVHPVSCRCADEKTWSPAEWRERTVAAWNEFFGAGTA